MRPGGYWGKIVEVFYPKAWSLNPLQVMATCYQEVSVWEHSCAPQNDAHRPDSSTPCSSPSTVLFPKDFNCPPLQMALLQAAVNECSLGI